MEGGILSVSPPNDSSSEDPSTTQQNGESPKFAHERISKSHTVDALPQPVEASCSDSLASTSGDTWPPPEVNAQNSNKDPKGLGTDALHLEGTRIIAKGIASVLDPVMRDFDARAEGALKSQGILRSSIDRLTRELDKLLEDAPAPFITQNSTKLSAVRKRVSSLTSTLQVVQKRIDNIERMLSGQVLRYLVKQCVLLHSNCRSSKEAEVPIFSNRIRSPISSPCIVVTPFCKLYDVNDPSKTLSLCNKLVFMVASQPTSQAPLQHVHASSLKGMENGPSSQTGESSGPHRIDQHDGLNDLDARKI